MIADSCVHLWLPRVPVALSHVDIHKRNTIIDSLWVFFIDKHFGDSLYRVLEL